MSNSHVPKLFKLSNSNHNKWRKAAILQMKYHHIDNKQLETDYTIRESCTDRTRNIKSILEEMPSLDSHISPSMSKKTKPKIKLSSRQRKEQRKKDKLKHTFEQKIGDDDDDNDDDQPEHEHIPEGFDDYPKYDISNYNLTDKEISNIRLVYMILFNAIDEDLYYIIQHVDEDDLITLWHDINNYFLNDTTLNIDELRSKFWNIKYNKNKTFDAHCNHILLQAQEFNKQTK